MANGRSFGLGADDRTRHLGHPDHLTKQIVLVRPPVGRAGDGEQLGKTSLLGRHPIDDPTQLVRHQGLRRVHPAVDDQRHLIAEAPLELPSECRRALLAEPLGLVADQQPTVGAEAHGRRNLIPTRHQLGDGVLAVSRHRSRGERGAEVDAQPVRHHRDSLAVDS